MSFDGADNNLPDDVKKDDVNGGAPDDANKKTEEVSKDQSPLDDVNKGQRPPHEDANGDKNSPIDDRLKEEDTKNFTWEHFFHVHCGILREDALYYEKALIQARMSPLDCLVESLQLIVDVAKIPIGDKLKILKTLQRANKAMEKGENEKKRAKKTFGLEEYNEYEASIILKLAGGTKEYEIDWGIEQWEDGQKELESITAEQTIKHGPTSYLQGAGIAMKVTDPTFILLTQYFAYETFEYTNGKDINENAAMSLFTADINQLCVDENNHPDKKAMTSSMYC